MPKDNTPYEDLNEELLYVIYNLEFYAKWVRRIKEHDASSLAQKMNTSYEPPSEIDIIDGLLERSHKLKGRIKD